MKVYKGGFMMSKRLSVGHCVFIMFCGSAPVYSFSGNVINGANNQLCLSFRDWSGLSITTWIRTCSGYLILLNNYNFPNPYAQRSNGSGCLTSTGHNPFQQVPKYAKRYYVYSGFTNNRVLTTAKVINGSTVIETASVASLIEQFKLFMHQ